jgi:hypothetical protein
MKKLIFIMLFSLMAVSISAQKNDTVSPPPPNPLKKFVFTVDSDTLTYLNTNDTIIYEGEKVDFILDFTGDKYYGKILTMNGKRIGIMKFKNGRLIRKYNNGVVSGTIRKVSQKVKNKDDINWKGSFSTIAWEIHNELVAPRVYRFLNKVRKDKYKYK